ncbi:hypothetical protein [Pseudomonas sp. VD9]|uniref:hypothetical protein n=1 Tax=Pseudomonas sp. VD9 TaxID=3342076 RepID=UPI003C6C39DB
MFLYRLQRPDRRLDSPTALYPATHLPPQGIGHHHPKIAALGDLPDKALKIRTGCQRHLTFQALQQRLFQGTATGGVFQQRAGRPTQIVGRYRLAMLNDKHHIGRRKKACKDGGLIVGKGGVMLFDLVGVRRVGVVQRRAGVASRGDEMIAFIHGHYLAMVKRDLPTLHGTRGEK